MSLLTSTEAAIYLGITKELLFAYIRNAPKKHLGENRKLNSTVVEGQNYFSEQDLNDFDDYLKTPWSKVGEPRPPIPNYIKDYLKVEIGGKCPITGKGYPLDDAHIIPYSQAFNHHHHNLIRVAKEEHTKADNEIIPSKILRETKDILIEQLRNKLKFENSKPPSSLQPPRPHPVFIGRAKKLIQLVEVMQTNQLVVIEGLGGIGKTQLLLNALENVKYHNPVVWIDIETVSNLSDLLILLNNAVSKYHKNSDSLSLIEALREIQITFIFDSLEKLLINERDETEEFIGTLLTQTNYVQLIITTQIDFSVSDLPKKIIKVEGLEIEDSILLFLELLYEDIKVTQENLYWITDFCNGHPLSIKLITALIHFFKSSDRAIRILEESGDLKQPTRKKQDKSTSLALCLDTIYTHLNNEQKYILHFIKFFPAGLKFKWAEEKFEEISFLYNIASLQQFFFVEVKEDSLGFERIIIPNPIIPFLKEKVEKESTEVELEIQKDAIDHITIEASIVNLHYVETGLYGSLSYGLTRIEDEMPNLLSALRIAQKRASYFGNLNDSEKRDNYLKNVGTIASSLGRFCFTRSYTKYGFMFAKSGIEAYEELKDYKLASSQYMYLAQIQLKQFDIKGLKDTVKNLENLANNFDDKENTIKINAVWAKGLLNFEIMDFNEARNNFVDVAKMLQDSMEFGSEDYNDSIRIASKKGDIGNLCILNFNIAKTYEFQGNYLKAIPIHKRAITDLEKNYSFEFIGSNYHHLAHCLCKAGYFQEGIEYYYKAIDSFSISLDYEHLANSISDLGMFVDEHPEIVNHPILNEERISLAFSSITNQLSDLFNHSRMDLDSIPFDLLGKVFWIMKAISFSQYCIELTNWVTDLLEELTIDISEPKYFCAMLNLAHCVGGVNEWKDDKDSKLKVIKSILQCALIVNGGPDLKSETRVFFWLAQWMRFTNLQPEATAEKLWDQAWNSFDN